MQHCVVQMEFMGQQSWRVFPLKSAQNEMHGGQSIPAFDFYMAPFVKVTYERN